MLRLGQARGPGAGAMTNFFHVLNMRCMYKIDGRRSKNRYLGNYPSCYAIRFDFVSTAICLKNKTIFKPNVVNNGIYVRHDYFSSGKDFLFYSKIATFSF